MVDNARPSRDPANDDSLTGLFRIVLRKFLQQTDDMLPVSVVAYDRARNRVRVKHQIQQVTTEGNLIERAQIASVPVLALGGGSFLVNFNLPAGSLGWIKSCDRDISLFLQGYNQSPPNDKRIHDFSSGVFIPDVMHGYTIDSEDEQAMVIQNLAGSVKISLNDARIKMTAPSVEIVANTSIIGTTSITGNTTIDGTLTNNGVNVSSTHNHPQGPDSAGNTQQNTGPPQ